MSNEIDYYELLQVSQDASDEQLREAVRTRRREWQHRVNAPSAEKRILAEARMRQIDQAERLLLNPTERSAYDRSRDGQTAAGDSRATRTLGFAGAVSGSYRMEILRVIQVETPSNWPFIPTLTAAKAPTLQVGEQVGGQFAGEASVLYFAWEGSPPEIIGQPAGQTTFWASNQRVVFVAPQFVAPAAGRTYGQYSESLGGMIAGSLASTVSQQRQNRRAAQMWQGRALGGQVPYEYLAYISISHETDAYGRPAGVIELGLLAGESSFAIQCYGYFDMLWLRQSAEWIGRQALIHRRATFSEDLLTDERHAIDDQLTRMECINDNGTLNWILPGALDCTAVTAWMASTAGTTITI